MLKADRWIGLLFLLFSLYVCVESRRLGLGTYYQPGPGFLSFYAGVFLGTLALILTLLALAMEPEKGEVWGNLVNIFLVTLALFGFALVLNWLGFVVATFLFIWVLLKVVERRGWLFSLGVSLFTSLTSYVVFDLWLRAQLPAGILGN